MVATTPVVDTGQPPPGAGPPNAPSTTSEHPPQSERQSEEGSASEFSTSAESDAGYSHNPTTSEVSTDTAPLQSASPRSRVFDDSGDAIMEGDQDAASSNAPKFDSDLQQRAQPTVDRPTTSQTSKSPTDKTAPTEPRSAGSDDSASAASRRPRRAARRAARQPQQATQATHPVWSPQGAAHIRATLSRAGKGPKQRPSNSLPEPGAQYYDQYACATAPASLKRDGDQRAMTPLEKETLHLWIQRQIHLPEPPLFLKETHNGAERDAFADYHRDHLGFRLNVILPIGVALSDANAKYHFCFTALHSAKSKEEHDRLLQLFRDALTTLCEPKSRIATLRFVHPEVRDAWKGFSFHFGTERVTLTATDSLSSDTPRAGLDAGARELLYHVFLRGHHRLSHRDVRAIGTAAAKMPVLDVEMVESIAASDYSPPKWKITFDSIACPTPLERIRRLEATYKNEVLVFMVMHPRAARRIPCSKCLSVRHAVKDCDTRDPTASLKAHSLALAVPVAQALPTITASPSEGDLSSLLDRLRQQAAPDVAHRLAQEARDRQAESLKQAQRASEARKQKAQLHAARREVARQLRALQLEYRAPRESLKPAHAPQPRVRSGSAPVSTQHGTFAQSAPDATARSGHLRSTTTVSETTVTATPDVEMADADVDSDRGSASAETSSANANYAIKASDGLQETASGVSAQTSTALVTTGQKMDAIASAAAVSRELVLRQFSSTEHQVNPAWSSALVVRSEAPLLAKRPASPSSREVGDGETVVHVKKWWRTSRNTDDANATTSALDSASSSPESPQSWSPLQQVAASPQPASTATSATGTKVEQAETIASLGGPEPTAAAPDAPANGLGKGGPSTGDKTLKQLPLSAFYGPLTLAEAQAQVEAAMAVTRPKSNWQTTFPSPELDARLAPFRSPTTLGGWLEALGARVVSTPATGACLYFAIHGTRTRSLHGANMTLCPTHVKEGGYYKKHICLTLELYLEPMLNDGTLMLSDFSRRCFQNGVPDDRRTALAALRSYLASVRKASVKSLTHEQWGGDEEIYAAIWFLRDPIFVLAVDPQGLTSIRALWLDRPHPRGPERIIHHLPSPGEAFEIFRVFLQHRVTPMVLVHTADHFNCVRFPEQLYQQWTADDNSGSAMRDRLDQALAQLGWYVAPRTAEDIPLAQVQLCESGSMYTPSEDCSEAAEAALLPATADPLSPTAYYALLHSINPRRRRRGPLALVWAQAERLNRNAYEYWNRQQTHPEQEEASQTLTAACRAWSAMPPAFFHYRRCE